MNVGTESLARASARKPWRTVVVWVVLLVTAGLAASSLLGDALTTSITFTDQPESDRAHALAETVRGEQFGTEFVVVTSQESVAGDPEHVGYVKRIQTALAGSGSVAAVGSYLTEDGPVSASGRTAMASSTASRIAEVFNQRGTEGG